MLKKKGMTLIESMVALTVAGTASAALIGSQLESNKVEEAQRKGKELSQLISAVDNRLATDGYDSAKWNKETWNPTNFHSDLTMKQLNSKDACADSTWTPLNATSAKIKPLPCDGIWKKSPYGMNIFAKSSKDTAGMIDGFEIKLEFKDDDHFEEEFKNIKLMLNTARSSDRHEIAGEHNYYFINRTTNSGLSTSECILEASNCSVKAEFNRSGGSEYVRADGLNSMIGSHLTFIEAKGQSPMKCIRWSKNESTGAWKPKTDSDCGIGIYKESGEPLVVELMAEQGSFKSVMLDKECDKLTWNTTTKSVTTSGNKVPCGMHTESEIIQVVENTQSLRAFIRDFYASNIDAGIANIDHIISDKIVTKELEVLQKSIMQDIDARNLLLSGTLDVVGDTTFGKAEIDHLIVNTSANINTDLNVSGTTTTNRINANRGDITTINATTINTNRINADRGDIKTINATTVTAPTGNFTNVNNRFNQLETSLNSLNNQINPPGPDYAEMERACNAAPDSHYRTTSSGNCTAGYKYYYDYFWNGSAKFCDKRSYSVYNTPPRRSNKECSGGGR